MSYFGLCEASSCGPKWDNLVDQLITFIRFHARSLLRQLEPDVHITCIYVYILFNLVQHHLDVCIGSRGPKSGPKGTESGRVEIWRFADPLRCFYICYELSIFARDRLDASEYALYGPLMDPFWVLLRLRICAFNANKCISISSTIPSMPFAGLGPIYDVHNPVHSLDRFAVQNAVYAFSFRSANLRFGRFLSADRSRPN